MATGKEKHKITLDEILGLNKEKARYVAIAESYVKDRSVAEEMFSQCLFKLVQSMDSQYVSDARAFFVTAIKNRCINFLMRKRKECGLNEYSLIERTDTEIKRLSEQCSREEFRVDVAELIAKCRKQIPDLTYEVFMAKRLDRMSYLEISRMFRISTDRVNYEIKKALKIFREEFKDYIPVIALLLYGLLCIGGGGYSVFIAAPISILGPCC